MNITHAKVSTKTDSADTTLVLPSDWNDEHVADFGYVSVIDYGAVGDGTTDDTVAFAAAIATGDNVLAPAGYTFVLVNVDMTTDGQVLFGGATLKIRAAASPGGYIIGMSGDKQRIEGMTFDARSAADQTWGIVVAAGTVDSKVIGNRFVNTAVGVSVYTATDILITGNTFYGYYGVLTRSNSSPERLVISHNVFIGTTEGDAIEINTPTGNAQDVSCIGNVISGYTNFGASGIAIGYAHVTRGVITGNMITGCGLGGVHIEDGASDIVVQGNTISDMLGDGIAVLSAATRNTRAIVVDGNHVSDCNQSGITLASPYPIIDSVVSNNIVRGCGTIADDFCGIQIGYTDSGCRVIGNIVSNTVGILPGAGIQISDGTHLIVQGNHSFDDQTPKTQLYGLSVQGTQTDVQVINNNFQGNLTGPISDAGGVKTRYYVHSNLGVTPAAVTGSRGGNAALASALTTLAAMGLITDSSS